MASKNISAFEYVYPPAPHPPAPPTRHSRAPRFHSLGFGQIPRPRWRFQPWTRPSPPHAWCTIPRFFCSSSSGRHRKWTNTGWFPSWPRVGGLRNWTEHYNFLIFRHIGLCRVGEPPSSSQTVSININLPIRPSRSVQVSERDNEMD
jgi:hypothetical protein